MPEARYRILKKCRGARTADSGESGNAHCTSGAGSSRGAEAAGGGEGGDAGTEYLSLVVGHRGAKRGQKRASLGDALWCWGTASINSSARGPARDASSRAARLREAEAEADGEGRHARSTHCESARTIATLHPLLLLLLRLPVGAPPCTNIFCVPYFVIWLVLSPLVC